MLHFSLRGVTLTFESSQDLRFWIFHHNGVTLDFHIWPVGSVLSSKGWVGIIVIIAGLSRKYLYCIWVCICILYLYFLSSQGWVGRAGLKAEGYGPRFALGWGSAPLGHDCLLTFSSSSLSSLWWWWLKLVTIAFLRLSSIFITMTE